MTEEHVPAPPAPVQEYSAPVPEYTAPERVVPAPEASSASLATMVLQAKLAVGPAADPYEDEADDVAEQVVETLRVQRTTRRAPIAGAYAPIPQRIARRHLGGQLATPPPPIEVRRIMRSLARRSTPVSATPRWPVSRIQRAASIGADGGDVDADTEQAIRQSSGKIMPAKARSTMEGAFGADFSNVRVHTGPTASELSTRIQAKAFTTGNDIFFRDGMPDTTTMGGQSLLAHELTHTIQQTGQTQRSAAIIRRVRWRFFGKKTPADPMVSEPVPEGPDHPDTQARLAAMGYTNIIPAGKGFKNAAKTGSAQNETIKPAGVVTASGVAGGVTAGAVGEAGMAGPIAGGAIGFATAGGAVMDIRESNSKRKEGAAYDDAAMSEQAALQAKDSATTLATGLASGARGTATTVDVAQGTARVAAEGGAVAAAGVAAGVAGTVAGTAMVIQGAWRGGKALVKLFRLTHGRGKEMLSAAGERWKKVVVAAERFKVAINGLKIAAGALGIAAGALMIVGSPIGWAVGLAAAIVGGVYAASKIISKVQNLRAKMNAHAALAGLQEIGDPTDVTRAIGGGEREEMSVESMGYDMSKVRQAGPQNAADTGSGFAEEAGTDAETPDDTLERISAIEQTDQVATMAGKNARIASEMRAALADGDKEHVFSTVEKIAPDPDANLADVITAAADQRLFDAFSLLSAINVDPELALADSGQSLIEQKLSKSEAM